MYASMNGYTAEGQQNMRLGWQICYKRKYQCPNEEVVQTNFLIQLLRNHKDKIILTKLQILIDIGFKLQIFINIWQEIYRILLTLIIRIPSSIKYSFIFFICVQ